MGIQSARKSIPFMKYKIKLNKSPSFLATQGFSLCYTYKTFDHPFLKEKKTKQGCKIISHVRDNRKKQIYKSMLTKENHSNWECCFSAVSSFNLGHNIATYLVSSGHLIFLPQVVTSLQYVVPPNSFLFSEIPSLPLPMYQRR